MKSKSTLSPQGKEIIFLWSYGQLDYYLLLTIMGKMHFDLSTNLLSSEEALVNCLTKYFSSNRP